MRDNANLNFHINRQTGSYFASYVPQLLAADVVLLVGGRERSAPIGYVAPVLRKPVLAIPRFGGNAREQWQSLLPMYRQLGDIGERLEDLYDEWLPSRADLVVSAIRELARSKLWGPVSRTGQILYLGLMVPLVAVWVVLFARPIEPSTVPFFAMLMISALLGTGLRVATGLARDPLATVSVYQLVNETVAGVLLGFGVSLMYLIGGLTVTGKLEFLDAVLKPTDFDRVAVVMSAIGFAAGLLFDQVIERVRLWLAGVVSA